jgi:hypothetical protein
MQRNSNYYDRAYTVLFILYMGLDDNSGLGVLDTSLESSILYMGHLPVILKGQSEDFFIPPA